MRVYLTLKVGHQTIALCCVPRSALSLYCVLAGQGETVGQRMSEGVKTAADMDNEPIEEASTTHMCMR